ncbi:helix-turn-helix transcriptional regulator [Arthrobacter sp. GMC3]|uniref:helix-turn-helix domain-containing protein n=1 Tax=Arthrobacter sp. GMC3 TaxID=2058894 RepID=UPI000CE4B6BB|nr:helix-turn-helix transcriptional regulator [Arthrobacter sp. GMC3]
MGTYGNDIQAAMVTQIKAEMAARDWKQPNLAKASGIPTSTLARYLSGDRDVPLPAFAEIASSLGLTYIELATRAQRRLDGENVQ